MRFGNFQSKDITRKIERTDQTATVIENIVSPDTAGLYFVEIFGRLSFAKNAFAA